MIERHKLYLPKSKREVDLEISIPRYNDNIIFDTLYLLDGQNAFNDNRAAFGRSIRATKYLRYYGKVLNKRILGIAIYNSGSDMGRVNEYTPFKIDNPASLDWQTQDIQICNNFCDDFINTIIPYIENKYNTYKSPDHRFIYGSSLAAITALYLAFKYKNSFNYVGAFSTASFLFEKEFYNFLDNNINTNKRIFLYVGKKESSDAMYDTNVYYNSSIKLLKYLRSKDINTRLVIDPNGSHNEETWGNHLSEFINYIYYDDIIISPRSYKQTVNEEKDED